MRAQKEWKLGPTIWGPGTGYDYVVYEMLFIKEIKPTLNRKSVSIRDKLFE